MREQEFKKFAHDLSLTDWWKVSCLAFDIYDFLDGSLDAKKFKEYALLDLEILKKKIEDVGED